VIGIRMKIEFLMQVMIAEQ